MKRNQAAAFHLPLHAQDTASSTFGCRHTNPDICAKNSLEKVCAFTRLDGMCTAPPASWSKQFQKLKSEQEAKTTRER